MIANVARAPTWKNVKTAKGKVNLTDVGDVADAASEISMLD